MQCYMDYLTSYICLHDFKSVDVVWFMAGNMASGTDEKIDTN